MSDTKLMPAQGARPQRAPARPTNEPAEPWKTSKPQHANVREGRAHAHNPDRSRGDPEPTPGFDRAGLVALAAMLVAVREVAARACVAELPPIPPPQQDEPVVRSGFMARMQALLRPKPAPRPVEDPLAPRRAALSAALAARLNEFRALPGVRREAAALLGWLAEPQAAEQLEKSRIPGQSSPGLDAFDARCVTALHTAWRHVTGQDLASWFCDERLLTGEHVHGGGVCPLLSQVNGGEAERAPDSIRSDLRLDLKALNRRTVMPQPQAQALDAVASEAYAALWSQWMQQAAELSRTDSPLAWFDGLDSLVGIVMHAVPADAFEPQPLDGLLEVVRLVAACGASLVLHGEETSDGRKKNDDPYRLVVGEFSPIQEFILGTDPHTPWPSDAVVCGRSNFVKIASELAAHAILDRLNLPSVCRLFGGASKFVLLAPNTQAVEDGLKEMRRTFDRWSVGELAGSGGISLAWTFAGPAAVSMLPTPKHKFNIRASRQYKAALHTLEATKLHRFELLVAGASPVLGGVLDAIQDGARICSLDGASVGGRAPEGLVSNLLPHHEQPLWLSRAAAWQLALPGQLGRAPTLALRRANEGQFSFFGVRAELDHTAAGRGRRWDIAFGLRDEARQRFAGLPIRFIGQHSSPAPEPPRAILKGDVDRLGRMFTGGIPAFNLVRLARVSRELEQFFSLMLPRLLQDRFPSVQTVLAGGDDFAFIGPPAEILALADELPRLWQAYACNPSLTFSIGVHFGQPGVAVQDLDRHAEAGLSRAKQERNSIDIHGRSITWGTWDALRRVENEVAGVLAHVVATASDGGAASRARKTLLGNIRKIASGWDDPREFSGLRWRALLLQAVSTFCSQTAEPGCAVSFESAFATLERLLDQEGFRQHGKLMLIPLGNLALRPAAELPATSPFERAGPSSLRDDRPVPDIDEVLARIDLARPSAQLFGETAMELARGLRAIPRRNLSDLREQLRQWDQHCGRRDEEFVLLRPQLSLYAHRPRTNDTPVGVRLKRGLTGRITDAEQLHCVRWLFETAMTYYGIWNHMRKQSTHRT